MDVTRRNIMVGAMASGSGLAAAQIGPAEAQTAAGSVMFAVAPVVVPIVGSDKMFQVRRIYCIGRN